MQLLHDPPIRPPATPVKQATALTPFSRPPQGRTSTHWPFYVQAPKQFSDDVRANALRVLETSARYFFSASSAR
ncbi:hypothetical protein [Polaromonas aquatica]|uniref:hypothetical protein n=1 Tax=Polaromonas aquatica TaxID=332657 RepID=UPI003D64D99E